NGYSMKKAMTVRSSMIWNTLSSRVVSRPATTRISIRVSQPAIHSAALGLEGVRFIGRNSQGACRGGVAKGRGKRPVSATPCGFATGKYADAVMRRVEFRCGSGRPFGAKAFLLVIPRASASRLWLEGASETSEPGMTVRYQGELAHAHSATGRMVKAARLLARRRGRWSGPMDCPCRPDRRRREG